MTSPPTRDLCVLLIEDNPGDVELVREALSDNGIPFHVDTAARLAEGLEQLDRGRHDLVLLDLGLPDSSGTATFHRLHESHPDVPIVILTVFGDEEQAVRAVAEGAQDFLVKDELSTAHLPRAVRYAVERHRMLGSLQHLADDLRTLLAHAAHDLQTPLATVAGLAETIEVSRDQLEDRQLAEMITSVRRQAGRVSSMVQELLDLAKAGKAVEAVRVNLRGVVHRALRDAPPPSGVHLDLQLAPVTAVAATRTRLERMLTNLLTNAYRYGGGTVRITTSQVGDAVRLTVSDDGPGIPDDAADRLFAPFNRGPNRTSDSTGLGLSIVHDIVVGLAGSIAYDRHPDLGGARFTVDLPTWGAAASP